MNSCQAPESIVEFRDALPAAAARSLLITQAVRATVETAVRLGWTPKQLAEECGAALSGVVNAGAVVQHRLRRAALQSPPQPLTRRWEQPKPWCGTCSDQWARWREDPDTGRPLGRCDCWTQPPVKEAK